MRVLAVCLPSPGHVNPLLPLLTALVDAGSEVVVATGDDVRDSVTAVGATHVPAGRGFDAWFPALAARIRGNPGDGLPPERISAYFVPRLFGEIAAADMVDAVIGAGRAFEPDLVIFETFAFAGPLAAAVLGRPAAHQQIVLMPTAEVAAATADALTPLWSSFGVLPDRAQMLNGALMLRTMPACLEPEAPSDVPQLLLRPVPLPAPASASAQQDARPTVHATLGTVLNSNQTVLRSIIDALADEAVQVILTIGRGKDPAVLGSLPANIQVAEYIPHAELLPRCAVIIHHGGAGTTLSALAHGLPQVVIPQGADQFINGTALERAGLGITLPPGHDATADIRAAFRAVHADQAFADRAADAAAELAEMPDADVVAAQLMERFGSGAAAD